MLVLCFVVLLALSTAQNHHDVCVIGAGASGMQAAVKLKEANYDVVVLERADRVGGNCETWFGPQQGLAVPLGVILYPDIEYVTDTFKRWNVSYSPFPLSAMRNELFVDFRNDKPIVPEPHTIIQMAESFVALEILMNTKYSFFKGIGQGFPTDINDDLALPWNEFADKHGLNGLTEFYRGLSAGYDQGQVPAYFALKLLRLIVLEMLTGKGLQVNEHCDAIYKNMGNFLGERNLLLNSTIKSVYRPNGKPSSIVYSGSDNRDVAISCDDIVVAYRVSEGTTKFFDLDQQESAVFSQVVENFFGTGAFSWPGKSCTPLYWNAWPETRHNFPEPPSVILVQNSNQTTPPNDYFNAQMISKERLTLEQVEELFVDTLSSLPEVGVNPDQMDTKIVKLHDFAYGPTPENAKAGFFNQLEALQGHRRTFYTSALLSFEAQFDCWQYSENLVKSHFPLKPAKTEL